MEKSYFGQLSLFMDKHKAEVRSFPHGELIYVVGLFDTKEQAYQEIENTLKQLQV